MEDLWRLSCEATAGEQENLLSGGILSYPVLSGPFAVWVMVWVREFSAKKNWPKKSQKSAEIKGFRRIFGPSGGI